MTRVDSVVQSACCLVHLPLGRNISNKNNVHMHIVCATFRKQTRLDFKRHMWQFRVPIHHRPYIILWRHILCFNSIFMPYTISRCLCQQTHEILTKCVTNPSTSEYRRENNKRSRARKPFVSAVIFFSRPPPFHIISSTSNLAKWQFSFSLCTFAIRPYFERWNSFFQCVQNVSEMCQSATVSHNRTQNKLRARNNREESNCRWNVMKLEMAFILELNSLDLRQTISKQPNLIVFYSFPSWTGRLIEIWLLNFNSKSFASIFFSLNKPENEAETVFQSANWVLDQFGCRKSHRKALHLIS